MSTTTQPIKAYDYKKAADSILSHLRRDRDRQVIAKRFGFDLPKHQTLEQIGREFGITRERVRQIEKSTLQKIRQLEHREVAQAGQLLAEYLAPEGGLARIERVASKLGAHKPAEQAYIVFLANLAPEIELIDEDDQVHLSVATLPEFTSRVVKQHAAKLVDTITRIARPAKIDEIAAQTEVELDGKALENLAHLTKPVATHESLWGLTSWPEVNPKSIRDKTYLVLLKAGKPMHFSEIARQIRDSNFARRDVTVQAVHNELIKDPRFILIGRGIYALREWGYTPGTVADIIVEILRDQSPLHKDEIIRRVLEKRQVKTTTIILNLQEKAQFERVAKATYKLREQ